MKKKDFNIIIIGSTGSGKTSLSLKLAESFNCEIINSDIGSFYKEFNIEYINFEIYLKLNNRIIY